MTFAGKTVVITGATRGIGKAIGLRLAREGATIVIAAKSVEENPKLGGTIYTAATEMEAAGGKALAIPCDIRFEELIQQVVDKAVATFGGIDILISNAGTAIGGSIAEVDDKILRQSFEDNFFSHQNCASESVKIMKKQNIEGCLLFNISKQSVNPGKNFGPYGLPKSALLNLCKQYAVDYGSLGIRSNGVNADRIRSGLLNDGMIKSRAKAREVSTDEYMRGNLLLNEVKAEDVAKAFFHLAVSKKTTGAVLTVDGGNIAASLR